MTVIHRHPLAYLLGLEGIALLRAYAGEYDLEFTRARLREIRELLDAADELGEGVEETPMTIEEGYALWAPSYDEPGNGLLEAEEPVVREILDALPVGVALDAGCGTGRHAAYLASLGHKVIGVDATPEMLDVARAKVPAADFYEAELDDLPVADDSVDVLVCAIAVSHVPDLAPVLLEFARVLRRGGHLVLSDSRGLCDIGFPLARIRPDGTFGYIPVWGRLASDYLAAALPLGFEVRRCDELRKRTPLVDDAGRDLADPDGTPEHKPGALPITWALHRFAPAATNAAYRGTPHVIVWHFELARPAT